MTTPSITELAKAAIEAHDAIYADPKVTWLSHDEALKESVAMLRGLELKLRENHGIRPESDHLYTIISTIRAFVSLTSRVEMLEGALKPFAKLLKDLEDDGDYPPLPQSGSIECNVPVNALRRAARALSTAAKPDV